jgi:hypothetical protein
VKSKLLFASLLAAALAAATGSGLAQSHTGVSPSDAAHQQSGAEILSDTRGVDFGPYVKALLLSIRTQWIQLLPDETRPPTNAKGGTDIRFAILPNGTLGPSMHLDASTHDFKLDRAAWGAISTQKTFPPLPAEFTGPNLELRIRFRVNLD